MWSSIVCNNRVITLELSKRDLNSGITRQLLFHYSTRGSRECLGNSLVSVTFIMRDLPPKFSNQNQEQEPPQALQICVSVMCAAAAAYHNSLLFVLRLLRRRHFKGNSTQLHLAVPQFHRILCQQRNNSEITTTTPAVNNHFEGKHQTSSGMLLLIRNNTKASPQHHPPTSRNRI